MRFYVLLLAEPKIIPKQDTIMKMSVRDFADQIIHNGESVNKANIWIIMIRGTVVNFVACDRQHVTVLINNYLVTAVHALVCILLEESFGIR